MLETEGFSPDWLPPLQPRLLRILAPCHLDSWVGLQLAALRTVLLLGKIHGCHINVVFIRRQTEGLRSLSATCRCRRNPTVENVDTFLFTQTNPFTVCLWHMSLCLGSESEMIRYPLWHTFDADTKALCEQVPL